MQNLYFHHPLNSGSASFDASNETDTYAEHPAFNASSQDKHQAAQALAKCGLKAESCVAIDYQQFRELMDNFDAPSVHTERGNTVIFDRHGANCVLIKPPYFDANGQCQPIRYFWLEATQPLMPHLRFRNYLLKSFLVKLLRLPHTLINFLGKTFRQHKQKKLAQRQKHGVTVWTSMRLTA